MAGMRRSKVSAVEWRDVTDATDGAGVLVAVRQSKTNPDGDTADLPLPQKTGPPAPCGPCAPTAPRPGPRAQAPGSGGEPGRAPALSATLPEPERPWLRHPNETAKAYAAFRGHVVPGRAFRDVRQLLHGPFEAHTVLVGVRLRPFLGQLLRNRPVARASQPILHGIAPSHRQALGFPLRPWRDRLGPRRPLARR